MKSFSLKLLQQCNKKVMSKEQRWTAFYIPSGKELPRTPPMGQVKKELLFSDDDQSPLAGSPAATTAGTPAAATTAVPARDDLRGSKPDGTPLRRSRIESTVCPATVSSRDSIALLRGMSGYQLTPVDRDFIERMNEKRVCKPLEEAHTDMDRARSREAMALDLALARQKKALKELKKFPSCDEMVGLARAFMGQELPEDELEQTDGRTLLAVVEEPAVRIAILKQKCAIVALKDRIREKEEKAKQDQEKRILEKKHEIKGLKIQLASLQSELAQETEQCGTLEATAAEPPLPVKIKTQASVKQEAVSVRLAPKSARTRSATTRADASTPVTRIPKNAAGRGARRKTPSGSSAIAPLPATTRAAVSKPSDFSLRRSERIASKK